MAISTYSLISLTELKGSLGGGYQASTQNDSDLTDICNKASDKIEKYLDRFVVTRGDITAYFTPPHYATKLYLYEWPVISVTSVYQSLTRTYDSTTLLVANTDYVVSAKPDRFGYITRIISPNNGPIYWWPYWRATKIVYAAGYATTATAPDSLKAVALQLGAIMWRERDKGVGGAISSESSHLGQQSQWSAAILTSKMKEDLAPFKRPEEFYSYEERDS